MIRSFRDRDTRALFDGETVRRFAAIAKIARRKLDMLDAAHALEDLRVPPGNRLERLKSDRASQFSIRVNDQWRLCFVWTEDGPEEAEMVDYH